MRVYSSVGNSATTAKRSNHTKDKMKEESIVEEFAKTYGAQWFIEYKSRKKPHTLTRP